MEQKIYHNFLWIILRCFLEWVENLWIDICSALKRISYTGEALNEKDDGTGEILVEKEIQLASEPALKSAKLSPKLPLNPKLEKSKKMQETAEINDIDKIKSKSSESPRSLMKKKPLQKISASPKSSPKSTPKQKRKQKEQGII